MASGGSVVNQNGIGGMDATSNTTGVMVDSGVGDLGLEAISQMQEMKEGKANLTKMQNEVEQQMVSSPAPVAAAPNFPTQEEKIEADSRSVYVGNVDYSATTQELEQHFRGCGRVNRVTILCDKFSGHPKGFAYVEFADKESVVSALRFDDSMFKGRQIKVNQKRTNRPGISTTNRGRGRGRGMAIRGGGGGVVGRGQFAGGGQVAGGQVAYGGGPMPWGFVGGQVAGYPAGYAPQPNREFGRFRGRAILYSPY